MKIDKGITYLIGTLVFGLLGYKGVKILEKNSSYISANGLSDKIVKSDQAKLIIGIENHTDSPKDAKEKRVEDKKAVIDLLLSKGFDKTEIIDDGCTVRQNWDYEKSEKVKKYRITDSIGVESSKVDLVKETIVELSQLIDKNIFTEVDAKYLYKDIDKLRIDMLEEASKDSLNRAEHIANNTGNKITGLRSLSTGKFSVFSEGSKSNYDNDDYYSNGEGSIMKRIRVVVKGTYNLK